MDAAAIGGTFSAAKLSPRLALYTGKGLAQRLELLGEDVTDDQILDAMVQHPVLVNRPIVTSQSGARLCRPPQTVLDLLSHWPAGPYALEDGTEILNANGKRLDG